MSCTTPAGGLKATFAPGQPAPGYHQGWLITGAKVGGTRHRSRSCRRPLRVGVMSRASTAGDRCCPGPREDHGANPVLSTVQGRVEPVAEPQEPNGAGAMAAPTAAPLTPRRRVRAASHARPTKIATRPPATTRTSSSSPTEPSLPARQPPARLRVRWTRHQSTPHRSGSVHRRSAAGRPWPAPTHQLRRKPAHDSRRRPGRRTLGRRPAVSLCRASPAIRPTLGNAGLSPGPGTGSGPSSQPGTFWNVQGQGLAARRSGYPLRMDARVTNLPL
jgi:hypothetical protein